MNWARSIVETVKGLSFVAGVSLACALLTGPAKAQLQQQNPDPLARIRAAAAANSRICTTKEPTACAEAVPKIVANAKASPQLLDNERRFASEAGANWVLTAFKEAGADEVHAEALSGQTQSASANAGATNIVAEITGREKPREFVVLGAHLPATQSDRAAACNAALLIEAARDIHLTGLRPRRSIRFVLFTGLDRSGSQAYVQAHSSDLDNAIAAIIFGQGGCESISGFSLGARQDIESGIRESFSVAPIDTWDIRHDTYDAPWGENNFDFILQGVPTLLANRANSAQSAGPRPDDAPQRNAAIGAVLAFSLAEHVAPLGPRLSRVQIEDMLAKTGWDTQMKAAGLWPDWEAGRRGRQR